MEGIPKIIEEVGFDFDWSNEKVWALDLSVEMAATELLAWHFEIPFWDTPGGEYDLKPIDVIKFPDGHKEEYDRAMQADLSHPIDIMENKGRWLILDGLHRLVKARILRQPTIQIRKIPRSMIPLITV